MKSFTQLSAVLVASAALSACAKYSQDIPSQYVSPLQYSNHSCKQIEAEMMSVSSRISQTGAQVDKTANNDSAKMGVGLVLFLPTLFFLDGDTPQAAEYARLTGEFEALEKAAIQKNCGVHVERPVVRAPQVRREDPEYPSQSERH